MCNTTGTYPSSYIGAAITVDDVPVLSLDDVLADVMRRDGSGTGIRLVGVDGPSGSGKSALAARLAARASAPVVEIDDFVSWPDFAGWWPRFETQVLSPLLSGAEARYQVRDWANDEFGTSLDGWKTLAWAPLVILEGVTLHPAGGRAPARLLDLGRGTGGPPAAAGAGARREPTTVSSGSPGWPRSASSSPPTGPAPGPTCGSPVTRRFRTTPRSELVTLD